MLKYYKSNQLFRIRWILSSSLIFLGLIIFIYYSQDNLKDLATSSITSSMTGIFLNAMVDIHPEDEKARMMLVKHYYNLGKWSDAYNKLLPISRTLNNWKIRLLMIDILKNELYSINPENNDYNIIKSKLIIELKYVIENIESFGKNELIDLAVFSKQLSRPDISSTIYVYLANVDSSFASYWLDLAAESQLAFSDPYKAAKLYHSAFMKSSQDTDSGKYYSHKAIKSFIYADKLKTALIHLPLYLNRFPEDKTLLSKGIDISLALQEHTRAIKYGTELLSLDPDNELLLINQRDLGLSTGNYEIALTMSKRLIDIYTHNINHQQKHAQIAEWSQKYDIALAQWKIIAYEYNNHNALEHTIRLSKIISDYHSLIDALIFKSKTITLTDNEIDDIVYAFTKVSNSSSVMDFLKKYTRTYYKHIYALKTLAHLYEKDNSIENAFSTWTNINKYAKDQFESYLKISELTRNHNEKLQAFSAAMKDVDVSSINNKRYLEIIGSISWELNMSDISNIVYSKLWSMDNNNTLFAERLITLLTKNNLHKKAVDMAINVYNNGEHPRFLLLAIDIHISNSEWSHAKLLIESLKDTEIKLNENELFCVQSAFVAVHTHNYLEAEKYYNRALSINPASITAEIGLLWLYIDTNNNRRLTEYFTRKKNNSASTIPEFWEVYAIALAKLGWISQSQYWYQLIIKNNKHNINTLKSLSETLELAGNINNATRLNNYIFSSQRYKLLRPMDTQVP